MIKNEFALTISFLALIFLLSYTEISLPLIATISISYALINYFYRHINQALYLKNVIEIALIAVSGFLILTL